MKNLFTRELVLDRLLVVCPINFVGLLDPRLLQEVELGHKCRVFPEECQQFVETDGDYPKVYKVK